MQVTYDPQTARWFYSAIRCDGTLNKNEIYVGFSKTSDPSDLSTAAGHGWCGYAYPTAKVLEDYPKLGLAATHIVIGSNAFNAETEAFLTAHILSLPKPAAGTITSCPAAPALSKKPSLLTCTICPPVSSQGRSSSWRNSRGTSKKCPPY